MKRNNLISKWLEKHGDPQVEKLVEQQAKQVMKKNNVEYQYLDLLRDILENGIEKSDRTGTGTISVFGRQIRHKMSEGFPLLTTKKMAFKTMVTELLWFLKGDTNIKYLVDNNCHIWDGDAYKAYLDKETTPGIPPHDFVLSKSEFIEKIKTDDEFAKKWGSLGPIYGAQWRSWTRRTTREEKIVNPGVYTEQIDQIANLIHDLKTNPDSRRLMVNAWNVGELDQMVLPPCHYGFQVYTRELSLEERAIIWNNTHNSVGNIYTHNQYDENNIPARAISLMFNMRSVDTFLGLPFNIASYALLLEIIAREVNMIPDELIGNLGDVHLYLNHIEQAKEQLTREPMKLPSICLDYREGEYDKNLTDLTPDDIVLFNYQSHPTIKARLSN